MARLGLTMRVLRGYGLAPSAANQNSRCTKTWRYASTRTAAGRHDQQADHQWTTRAVVRLRRLHDRRDDDCRVASVRTEPLQYQQRRRQDRIRLCDWHVGEMRTGRHGSSGRADLRMAPSDRIARRGDSCRLCLAYIRSEWPACPASERVGNSEHHRDTVEHPHHGFKHGRRGSSLRRN